ncbi:MAG: family 10 glycosylhydrolase [Planctomycetes bacterium]|nr:family 10 glycosylhydrolase [Planctomycetota bacterium]
MHRASLLAAIAVLAAPPAFTEEGRAFWLTRWNATDQGKIVECLAGMQALKANTLFCQVLGDGMALYRSALAPRSPLVAPGFDALAVAIAEGRRRGIEVHAYINICNVWSGGLGQPADPSHLIRAHPEWAVVDVAGRSDLEFVGVPATLIFFCPEWRGFRAHVVEIASEIAQLYEVGGIHLDYLRFPGGSDRCFCIEHRRNFAARFGRAPAPDDPDFHEWRYDNITGLFGEIYDAVTAIRPGIKVSAALFTPTGLHFQDARRILEAGKLDIAVPMIYTLNLWEFEQRALYFHEHSGGRLVYAGIASDRGAVFESVSIARRIGLEGQAFFAWSTLDDSGRAEVAALYTAASSPPLLPWKDGSPDTTPPVISGVVAQGILASEVTVIWHTDERSRSRVEYGRTQSLGLEAAGQGIAFDHAVRLAGLTPLTKYYFHAISTDEAGNVTRSSAGSFMTAAVAPFEVVVDDGREGFSLGGSWSNGSSPGGYGGGYIFSSTRATETAWALYRPYLPRAGLYEAAVWYVAGSNRASDARYALVHADGNRSMVIDQKTKGGRWNVLGTFRFVEGTSGYLRLSNQAAGGSVVIADAARFRLIEAEDTFRRGDVNGDGAADISDAIGTLEWLFLGTSIPSCLAAANANGDAEVDISDPIGLLEFLFLGNSPPPEPFPECGPILLVDDKKLGCAMQPVNCR